MSSSSSDNVTQSVRLPVRPSVSSSVHHSYSAIVRPWPFFKLRAGASTSRFCMSVCRSKKCQKLSKKCQNMSKCVKTCNIRWAVFPYVHLSVCRSRKCQKVSKKCQSMSKSVKTCQKSIKTCQNTSKKFQNLSKQVKERCSVFNDCFAM